MEKTEKLDQIYLKLWQSLVLLFNVKGLNFSYSVILFFFHLRHENIIGKELENLQLDNASNLINWFLYKDKRKIDRTLEDLFIEFHSDCEKIDGSTFKTIWSFISEVNENDFFENYEDIVEYFLKASLQFKVGLPGWNEYEQPQEITKLVSRLCNASENLTVYNPFSGLASYAVELGLKNHYYGQEINSRTWAIAVLRLLAHRINIDNFEHVDSVSNWKGKTISHFHKNPAFDLIIATPPFGCKVNSSEMWDRPYNKKYTLEELLILRGIEGLKSNGKLIGVFSNSILYDERTKQNIREFIVEQDILEMVITLPNGLFDYMSVSTSILILNMNKDQKGYVRMVDATSSFEKKGNKKILLENKVFDYSASIHDNEYFRVIPNSEIKLNDYNLVASRYTVKPINIPEGYTVVNLGDIASIYKNTNHKDSSGKYLTIKDLTDSPFESEVRSSNIQIKDLNTRDLKISTRVLLIANTFSNLKPTLCLASESEPIFCSHTITPLVINTDIIDIAYLINELSSNFVKQQVKTINSGGVIPYIKHNDLLGLKILLPANIDLQKAIVEGAKNATVLARAKEIGLESVIEKLKQEYIDEVRIKKHNLAQHLVNIQSSILALSSFVSTKGYGSELISEKRNITLDDHIKRLSDASKAMGLLLEQLTKDEGFGNPEVLNIDSFIKSYLLKYSHQRFDIDYTLDIANFKDLFIKQSLNDQTIGVNLFINQQDLTEVFDNVINNAIKHGFVDESKKDYKIQILVFYIAESSQICINFKNNGAPFPQGMDARRFSIKGEKAGKTGNEGIGGYRINSIVEHNGGSIYIENNALSQYPVSISINLPIENSNEKI